MKKSIFKIVLATSALFVATNVYAKPSLDELRTAKKVDVVCEGTSHYKRPAWQSILSFGLLDNVVVTTDKITFAAVPGGVDSIRFFMERNPDINFIIGKLMDTTYPNAIKSLSKCTSEGQRPLYGRYEKKEGVLIYEFTDKE